MNNKKIGVGYITCNREKNMSLLFKNFDISCVDERVIVNDTGTPYKKESYPVGWEIIEHEKNKSVGVSKNDALKYLMNKNCSWLFLIEDDIIIKDMSVFKSYIELAEKSRIRHLNFAGHGTANIKNGKLNPRFCVEYDEQNKMALYQHCVGAFTLYYSDDLNRVGLIDESFINAFDHVELTYRFIKEKLHPPFWHFADVIDSNRFFDEIGTVENNSVIRKNDKKFQDKLKQGRLAFQMKHGIDVLSIPDCPQKYIYQFLEKAQNENA